jgi:DNA-binding response OmpR family regulator
LPFAAFTNGNYSTSESLFGPVMAARILIVEDEMLVALELENVLEDLGHEPIGIVPDLQAAELYFDEALDLALVDLNLRDGLTGPEIGKRLGERGITVLFVTANPALLGRGVAGTIGVITKPTDERTVKAAVDYALGVRQGRSVSPPPALKLFG